ncbi:MAG: Stk1 family PASTA domain-containing Ser/Thr kinase [Oscillospiraceae bacterium]|nr:Stk1 family PASTA domain-containing Ser/Thr kinase [Oscillospiraceae bacterium]
MDKYIGKKLEGRYEILELIGFGGMAIVFKAYDLLGKRYVAVKILKDEYLESEDFKRRFRNESKAIALLSHPNIVKVLDVNFSDNIQYIVMEYIDGITLKEYIEQQGSVKWKEAVHFTVQILRALQHAHDNGIVHRDIKPQNVMLLEDGTIKVMDFGIARFARESGKTLSDKAIGSVHYISPEQAQGAPTDEKTDIYAVGVILYEMLTGRVPFDGDTPVSIAIKQMQIEPTRPTQIKPDLPMGLEEIILRAMQKEPALRYQTAAEMLRDIDEFKHNPDVVFEYRYFNSDGTTKYFDRVSSEEIAVEREPRRKQRSYTMNILAGVTAACVILAIVALVFFFRALSTPTENVVLPSLIGMTVDEARRQYPELDIQIVRQEPSADYDINQIIEQDPRSGMEIKEDARISVTVSTGIQSTVLGDYSGQDYADVKKRLESLGLHVEQVGITSEDVPRGQVVATDPPVNSEVRKGETVYVRVSLGAADLPVRVPDLTGRTEVEARALLAQYSLSLGQITAVDSDEEKGLIVEQSIEKNQSVPKGTMIDVSVSNGKPVVESVRVPVRFPSYVADQEHVFEIYCNGYAITKKRINPVSTPNIAFEFSLTDGKVNGMVDSNEDGINDITLLVDDVQVFAEYSIDFNQATYQVLREPQFRLLQDPDDEYIGE